MAETKSGHACCPKHCGHGRSCLSPTGREGRLSEGNQACGGGRPDRGTQASNASSDHSWHANIQNFVRADLHGSDIARALACVDISLVESDRISPLIDVLLRGDTATAYMDGQEVASLPDDLDGRCLWAPSAAGKVAAGKVQQGVWVGFRAPKEGKSRETTRERSLLERRVAELRTHKKGVLVVQRTAAGTDRLAGLQLYATVENSISVFVVNDVHGYANFLKRLCEVQAGSCGLRKKLCTGPARRPCTDKNARDICTLLPGVKKSDMASRMLTHFESLSSLLQSEEGDLIKVVGMKQQQAHRLNRFFRCRRGHYNYAGDNSALAVEQASSDFR